MDFKVFVEKTLQKASQMLDEETYDYFFSYQGFTTDQFINEEISNFIKTYSSGADQDFLNFILIQFINSIVRDHRTHLYTTCISQIITMKEKGIQSTSIELQLAHNIINDTDFENPESFRQSYENLQKIDLPNLESNNHHFLATFNKFLIFKRDEQIDFIPYIIAFKQVESRYKLEDLENTLEKLALALIFIAYNEKNVLSFLKFQKLYLNYFEKSCKIIENYYNSLISAKFKQILEKQSQRLSKEAEKVVVGQRKVMLNGIQYATKDSEGFFLLLMNEIVIIDDLLQRNQMNSMESLSFKKVGGKICAEVVLNKNLTVLSTFFTQNQPVDLRSFFLIFHTIVCSLLTLESFPLNFCIHPECILIDPTTCHSLALPGSAFCSIPKVPEIPSATELKTAKTTNLPGKIANLMEESLKYVSGRPEDFQDLRKAISTIRENSGIILVHIQEYLGSKLDF